MNSDVMLNLAQAPGTVAAYAFVEKFNEIILYPLILLLTGIAFLVFLYGSLIYIMNAENSSAREQGRSHIIYSLLGMFIMLIAYTLLQIAANTFGLNQELDCSNDPSTPGCDFIFMPNTGGTTNSTGGQGVGSTGGGTTDNTGGQGAGN